MKTINVVGWDNGFNSEKIVIGESHQKKLVFPSVTVERSKGRKIDFKLNGKKFNEERMMIKHKGIEYSVGKKATNNAKTSFRRKLNKEKFKDLTEKIKLMSGMSALFPEEEEITIENLYISHSLNTYNKYREEIIKEYENKEFKYSIPTPNNGVKDVILNIKNVVPFPQGISAYYDEILNYNGSLNKESELVEKDGEGTIVPTESRYLLVDIGENTTDAFIAEGQDVISDTTTSLSTGMRDVFDRIKNDFSEEISLLNLEQAMIDTLNENGNVKDNKITMKANYEKLDITDNVKNALKKVAEDIFNQTQSEWDRYSGTEDFAFTCGGGALFLGNYINDLYKEMGEIKHIVVSDPQFANANGLYKIGVLNNKNTI